MPGAAERPFSPALTAMDGGPLVVLTCGCVLTSGVHIRRVHSRYRQDPPVNMPDGHLENTSAVGFINRLPTARYLDW